MKALALLVRDEGHAKCKEQQKSVLDSIHMRGDRVLRTEAAFMEPLGDPIRSRDRVLRHIPPTSADGDRHQPLQEVAARRDQFCLELSVSFRIEREREAPGHFEIPLHRFGGLHPDERIVFGHGRAEIGERLDDERS
ncbi:MAG: hypothetical protein E6K03_03095 [Methanobacteriota archaeon]|nr:MAG: hypothetical protein E6K03_03095 [Euryarchaeota archaeon]